MSSSEGPSASQAEEYFRTIAAQVRTQLTPMTKALCTLDEATPEMAAILRYIGLAFVRSAAQVSQAAGPIPTGSWARLFKPEEDLGSPTVDELPAVTPDSPSIVRLGNHVIHALIAAREIGELPVIDTAEVLALQTAQLIARSDAGLQISIDG